MMIKKETKSNSMVSFLKSNIIYHLININENFKFFIKFAIYFKNINKTPINQVNNPSKNRNDKISVKKRKNYYFHDIIKHSFLNLFTT